MGLFAAVAGNSGNLAKGVGGGVSGALKAYGKGLSKELGVLQGLFGSGGDVLAKQYVNNFESWGGISQHLLMRLTPCDMRTGEILTGFKPIIAPINEVNIEGSFNWQSPFENAGAETKAPAVMSLIQSGESSVYLNALQGALGMVADKLGDFGGSAVSGLADGAGSLAGKAVELSNELMGRTGVTKLNSRQVFSGMPPIKLSFNLHLRAISDPYTEVYEPYLNLWSWAVPQELADSGALLQLYNEVQGGGSFIKGLFPSAAPMTMAFVYKGNVIAPMVIESISAPMDSPIDKDGNDIHKIVTVNMASMTAIDKNDVFKYFQF